MFLNTYNKFGTATDLMDIQTTLDTYYILDDTKTK